MNKMKEGGIKDYKFFHKSKLFYGNLVYLGGETAEDSLLYYFFQLFFFLFDTSFQLCFGFLPIVCNEKEPLNFLDWNFADWFLTNFFNQLKLNSNAWFDLVF